MDLPQRGLGIEGRLEPNYDLGWRIGATVIQNPQHQLIPGQFSGEDPTSVRRWKNIVVI